MMWVGIGLVVVWLGLQFKTSRADGTVVKVHPYRQMMPYIMQGRNESLVYYDDAIDAEAMEAFLAKHKDEHQCHVTHAVVAAVSIGLAEQGRMNQFVSGRRLYKRKQRQLTFSMKRKKLDNTAKLSVVKLDMENGETFSGLITRINGQIKEERSGKKTYMDKELDLFTLVPRPLMNACVKLFKWLDYVNLLPYNAFIKGDGMYTSCFIANLGSLGMAPAYHHLYEWGNCPLFLMVGKTEERAVVRDGEIVVRRILPLRWSYDERIDDGLSTSYGMAAVKRVLEDPETWLTLDAPLNHTPAS
ncbi:MAG: hypothetical protein ACI9WU_004098 [Myxococcota bacterium]|jgi:hypothetical protein